LRGKEQETMVDRATDPSLRQVMAAYPTGITVVAACDDRGEPYGLTVNSFTSVSLDPPLVLVCIGHASSWHDHLVRGSGFAINLLSAGQEEIAVRFSTEPSEGRFHGVVWDLSPSGSPVLEDAVAWLDCSLDEVLLGGDHSILVGRVESSGLSDRPSLLFHRGQMTSTNA
jgi:flavin reductase (DIM6/NTAB) family NADH-FMN oxidoreductase RutF